MEEKGAGRQYDSQMVCGHVVTKIARSLGLTTNINIRMCSPGVVTKPITRHDLETSGLVPRGENRLIEEGEVLQPSRQRQQQQVRAPRGRGGESGESSRVEEICNRIERKVDGMANYMEYHVTRYQPSWEYAAQQHAESSGNEWLDYEPPAIYTPQGDDEMDEDDD